MNSRPYSFKKRQDLRNNELTQLTLWVIKDLKNSPKEEIMTRAKKKHQN